MSEEKKTSPAQIGILVVGVLALGYLIVGKMDLLGSEQEALEMEQVSSPSHTRIIDVPAPQKVTPEEYRKLNGLVLTPSINLSEIERLRSLSQIEKVNTEIAQEKAKQREASHKGKEPPMINTTSYIRVAGDSFGRQTSA